MPNHDGIPVWEVEIPVVGLISVRGSFSLNVRKEINHPEAFYSEVKITPKDYGFLANLTAFAPTSSQAEQAGLVFLGRMLDVLTVTVDIALNVMNPSIVIQNIDQPRVKRVTDQDEILDAFLEARRLTIAETTYLRALGWFRKGKCTNDPLDRFLAFWIAIETVACKYNPKKDACKNKGSICHIWESFKHVWGECENWPLISGITDWIDTNNEKRVKVAHGTIATDIESVSDITSSLDEVEAISRKFLMDWRAQLPANVDPQLMR
ncbi:MAG: hypothetical protein BWK74_03505 [Desulfobacteraceae bacterium A6]|nr:MAG: hypothetical protein BWK74_03505 [Desulfobacteraceae bacterium A6]